MRTIGRVGGIAGIVGLMLLGATGEGAAAGPERAESATPPNPFITAPANPYEGEEADRGPGGGAGRGRAPSSGTPLTALDRIHLDESDDPISGVPDLESEAQDEAARRHAEAEARAAAAAAEPPAEPAPGEPAETTRAAPVVAAPTRPRALPPPVRPVEAPAPAPPMAAEARVAEARVAEARAAEALAAEAVARSAPGASDGALRELDAALAPAPRGGPVEPAVAEETGAPSRAAVHDAIARVEPQIRACASDQRGRVVLVHSVFAASGRVSSAVVDAPPAHLRPAQRSCIARAARAARTTPFSGGEFEVTYSVRL